LETQIEETSGRSTEIYANMVSNLVDNMIAATKLVNNIMFGAWMHSKLQCSKQKDNVKEVSRMSINAAKISNRYRDAERLTGNGTPNIYSERGEGGNRSERFDLDKNEEEIQRDRSGKAIA
jgi:hypothetical protein